MVEGPDSASSAVLSEDDRDVARTKLDWLKRHDRDSGDLYGMFPLVKGMPVALTDHLDRNPAKNLLKGKIGYIDSWVEHEDEDSAYDNEKRILRYVPKVVLVQYYDWVWSEESKHTCKNPAPGQCRASTGLEYIQSLLGSARGIRPALQVP